MFDSWRSLLPWILGAVALILLAKPIIHFFKSLGDIAYCIARLFRMADQQPKSDPPPRSCSGVESIVMPDIRRDFPEFDIQLAKNRVKDYIRKELSDKKSLRIYQVVLHRYVSQSVQKTIIFQASVSWREDQLVQKRYDVHYSYLLPEAGGFQALNCPNCGATIGFGEVECPYCGTRVLNGLQRHWEFTQMEES